MTKAKRRNRCSSCRKLVAEKLASCVAFKQVKLCQACLKKGCANCRYVRMCKLAAEINPNIIERAVAKLNEVEEIKDKISAARDDLRKAYSDLDDICETLKEGIPMVTSGLRDIRDGIDKMSELL